VPPALPPLLVLPPVTGCVVDEVWPPVAGGVVVVDEVWPPVAGGVVVAVVV
jgi:hypothetical protein